MLLTRVADTVRALPITTVLLLLKFKGGVLLLVFES
jgi:hypothetical protein